jgi:hypothetical protein
MPVQNGKIQEHSDGSLLDLLKPTAEELEQVALLFPASDPRQKQLLTFARECGETDGNIPK